LQAKENLKNYKEKIILGKKRLNKPKAGNFARTQGE
jgi:hypothetical protein